MQYYQQVRGWGSGRPTRAGVFRRIAPGDSTHDQAFDFRAGRWAPTSRLADILLGYADGEVVEVDEADVRAYFAEVRPDLDVDAFLAIPPTRRDATPEVAP